MPNIYPATYFDILNSILSGLLVNSSYDPLPHPPQTPRNDYYIIQVKAYMDLLNDDAIIKLHRPTGLDINYIKSIHQYLFSQK